MSQPARNRQSAPARFLTGSALLADMLDEMGTPKVDAPAPKPAPAQQSTDPAVRAILSMVDLAPNPAPKVATPAPKVATPAPAPKAKRPRKRKLKATWGRLPGDVWGVRCQGAQEGDKVTVVTKAGKRSTVTLGREVKPGLFEKVGRQTKAKPRRQCPGDNRCRRLGWPRGPRCR